MTSVYMLLKKVQMRPEDLEDDGSGDYKQRKNSLRGGVYFEAGLRLAKVSATMDGKSGCVATAYSRRHIKFRCSVITA